MPNETSVKTPQLCVLCGVKDATKGDGDHLPPQCIYPRPRQPNLALHKVPACIPCNSRGSKDDEVFKLIIGLTTGEYRVGEKQLLDSLAATMKGNKKLARKTLRSARKVWARNAESGVYQQMIALAFDQSAYARVVERIVRGMYWRETGTIMPQQEVLVMHGDEPEGIHLQQIKKLLLMLDPISLNGGAFTYKYSLQSDGSSFWAMQFFKNHTVFALATAVPKQSAETH